MIIQELEVWKKSREFRNAIFMLAKDFPTEEKFRLTDQIIRSSRSVSANVAEGYGRFHFQENIQYCRQARGSLVETYDHLTVAQDCGFISKEEFALHVEKYEELRKLINGYINFLQKSKQTK